MDGMLVVWGVLPVPHGRSCVCVPCLLHPWVCRYLRSPSTRAATHRRLYTLFVEQADPFGNGSWAGVDRRSMSEALYHAVAGGLMKHVAAMVTNLAFLAVAASHGLMPSVIEAYVPVGVRRVAAGSCVALVGASVVSLVSNVHAMTHTPLPTPHRFTLLSNATSTLPRATRQVASDFSAFVSAHLSALVAFGTPATTASTAREGVFHRAANWVVDSSPYTAALEWREEVVSHAHAHTHAAATATATATATPGEVARSAAFHDAWLDRTNKPTTAPRCRTKLAVAAEGAMACTVHPQGHTVAVACADWSVVLVSARTWDVQTTLARHKAPVRAVRFAPSGAALVSCGEDGLAVCWGLADGQPRARFTRHAKPVNDVAFLGCDEVAMTASDDCTIAVWSSTTGRELVPRIRAHSRPVTAIAATHDAAFVASGSWDQSVVVWRATSTSRTSPGLVEFRRLTHSSAAVRAVAWAPTTVRKLAAACFDGTVRVFDTEAGSVLSTLRGHLGPVSGLCFSPDGSRLMTTGRDRTLRLWRGNAAGGQLRAFTQHTRGVRECATVPGAPWVGSSHDMGVVSVADDGNLCGWTLPDTTVKLRPEPLSPVSRNLSGVGAVLVVVYWHVLVGMCLLSM